MNRSAILAELQQSSMSPLIQTCVSGVVLNLVAAVVILYLWRRDRGEVHLAFWSGGHLFSAVRWAATFSAVSADHGIAAAIAAGAAGATVTLNLLGAYCLIPTRRVTLPLMAFVLTIFFLALTLVGLATSTVAPIFGAASVIAWLAGAALFWRAHRANPLSAYRIAAFAMLFNVAVWVCGFALVGRGFVTSIFLPLTALPVMLAFFIIAHQRALAKARDSEETIDTLFDTVPVPIVISRAPGGTVERINRRAVEIFGMPASAYIGKTGPESGVIADPATRDRIYAALASGHDVRNQEMTYLTARQEEVLFSVNARRVELRDGLRYVFTMYDLTDYRRVEKALQDLNASLEAQVAERTRDLEAFGYSVSHDLRAPLRAIDGYSTLLADELGESLSAAAREYLARIRESCRRMNELIDAMISLSRQGTAALTPTLVDISTMADGILAELRNAEPGRAVEVRVEPWMRATVDVDALRIVLDNLLRNAWKYTARTNPARIDVGASVVDGLTVYHVRDNGAGFDMRHADDLFKPFRRLHPASEFEGSGIGLATVARVIRNLRGRVWAEAAVGEGATFHFTLGPASHSQRGGDNGSVVRAA